MINTCQFFHWELRSTAFSWTWLSSLSCLFLEWSGNPLCKRAWVLKALIFWTGTPSIFSRNQLPSSGKTPPQGKSMYRVTKALLWMVWAESQPPPVKIPHNKNEYRRVLLPGSFQILQIQQTKWRITTSWHVSSHKTWQVEMQFVILMLY